MKQMSGLGVKGILSVSGLSKLPSDPAYDHIPLVWIDRVPKADRQIPWVSNDDVSAMETATEYLIAKGCKNILLLPGFVAQGQESIRVLGYRNALKKHSIPFDENYILYRNGSASSEEESALLVKAALQRCPAVDAIIASSDRAAFGAIQALQKIEYFVPEDVRLISFDNSPYTLMASPSVTSLDRKPEQLAKRACEVLLQLIGNKEDVIFENIIDVKLVERGTTR